MQSLKSIVSEITALENKKIHNTFDRAGLTGVMFSPVLTGRFRGSWGVLIDSNRYQPVANAEASTASQVADDIERDAMTFDILEDRKITLYNNVQDPDSKRDYASTVKYDFTQGAAREIVEQIMVDINDELSIKD